MMFAETAERVSRARSTCWIESDRLLPANRNRRLTGVVSAAHWHAGCWDCTGETIPTRNRLATVAMAVGLRHSAATICASRLIAHGSRDRRFSSALFRVLKV